MNKKEELKAKMEARIKMQSTGMLKKMLSELMNNFEDGAGVVWCAVLNELESRMDEAEFTAYCEAL